MFCRVALDLGLWYNARVKKGIQEFDHFPTLAPGCLALSGLPIAARIKEYIASKAWSGEAWSGKVWCDEAGSGMARYGQARLGDPPGNSIPGGSRIM